MNEQEPGQDGRREGEGEERDESEDSEDGEERRLQPEDQARVDAFLERGVNSVERKPFRPMLLLIMLIVIVAALSIFSQSLARWAGVH